MEEKFSFDAMPGEVKALRQEMGEVKTMLQLLIESQQIKESKETWLITREVAELTKFNAGTIRMFTCQNRIPSHKVGGRRLFLKSEVLEWMEHNGRYHHD